MGLILRAPAARNSGRTPHGKGEERPMSAENDDTRRWFDARLRALGLDHLDAHDRNRLWQSLLKQRTLSESLDADVAPATEPAVVFQVSGDVS
ncbi:hypothetical protein HMH01_16445 [Halovulum dunhuangense]|uniref:Uncharacterized protein n=1 Tax=Halovulum dunhuangense TaxID=1505036 RepID=A0A849L6H4_9RHOB|nr:hypothetical protein [Halovulum dunhuangense]NNU82029.1 hypothetical protein [Halovulum dunhuangense]